MALDPDARLVVVRKVDVRSLPITPVDFFVFSRVEALTGTSAPTVAEVIAASGQAAEIAEQSIDKLLGLGSLELHAAQPVTPRVRPARLGDADDQSRRRALDRKRGLLSAQLRVANSHVHAPSTTSDDDDSLPTPRNDQKPAEPALVLRSILDSIQPAPAHDVRLDPNIEVALDHQRRLLGLRDRLRHVGHFEILGLDPVDDARVIRRAYHVVSREFHPDSFYGKELGKLRGVLDDLFRRARASYEFLLDEGRRRTLVEVYETGIREERERTMQAELDLRAAARVIEDEQRRQAEADLAARQQAAHRARTQRDEVRQVKLRERAEIERHKQAATHAAQAVLERESGRHGAAATLFRLAHEHDPDHPEYEREWRETLQIARRQRAEHSFQQAKLAITAGRVADAARLLSEAADADPSLRNLTEATLVMAEVDASQARSLAITTLETLQQAQARELKLDERVVAAVHQACARAFLAAGQLASAREQAERAHQLLGTKQSRALLNSIKLT